MAANEPSASCFQPPDGGYGWFIVFGGFIVYALAIGQSFAFGVLFVAFLDAFDASKAEAAWIGSLSFGLGIITNFIALALLKKYEHRTVAMIGGILYSVGLIASSFTTSIGQIYVTYGVFTSLGIWLQPLTLMAIIGKYFKKRLPLAVALALSGTGGGQFVMSVLIRLLLDTYGWRGTLLILGAIDLNVCVAAALLRPTKFYDRNYSFGLRGYKFQPNTDKKLGVTYREVRPQDDVYALDDFTEESPAKGRAGCVDSASETRGNPQLNTESDLPTSGSCRRHSSGACASCPTGCQSCWGSVKTLSPNWSLCRNVALILVQVTGFLHAAGQHAIISHTVKRAKDLGMESFNSSLLPAMMGLTQLFGRVLWGVIGAGIKKAGPNVLYASSMGLAGVTSIISVFLVTFAGQIAYMVIFGLFMACYVPLYPVVVHVILDVQDVNSGLVFAFQAESLGFLIGAPLVGWMRDVQGHYEGGFYVIGALFIIASVCAFLVPIADKYIVKKKDIVGSRTWHITDSTETTQ